MEIEYGMAYFGLDANAADKQPGGKVVEASADQPAIIPTRLKEVVQSSVAPVTLVKQQMLENDDEGWKVRAMAMGSEYANNGMNWW